MTFENTLYCTMTKDYHNTVIQSLPSVITVPEIKIIIQYKTFWIICAFFYCSDKFSDPMNANFDIQQCTVYLYMEFSDPRWKPKDPLLFPKTLWPNLLSSTNLTQKSPIHSTVRLSLIIRQANITQNFIVVKIYANHF